MRMYYLLNDDWQFCPGEYDESGLPKIDKDSLEKVDLPHIWNLSDPLKEGLRFYRREIELEEPGSGRSGFIEFSAVSGLCRVWLNGMYLGEHKGGYSRFRFSLDPAIRSGSNSLVVSTDNSRNGDINPIGGDFNNYAGIYRGVRLIYVEKTHFDLMHYGTDGLEIIPDVSGNVRVSASVKGPDLSPGAKVQFSVYDGTEQVVSATCPADAPQTSLTIPDPRLWDGRRDPHTYLLKARIVQEGTILDEISLSFGFREISLSPEEGFFLNGRNIRINGVSKHQDFAGFGCAPSRSQLDRDMRLILDLGANALRLSHYQHPGHMYDLCDDNGMIVWAEIPMLNMPEGNEALLENAEEQLKELILQNRHHPSICFWGLQNEIALSGETLYMYSGMDRLRKVADELDDSRITAGANLYTVKNNSPLNRVTEMIGYNIYFGWYYGEIPEFGKFLDKFHRDNPDIPLGVSEYGVDCNIDLHSAEPKRRDYSEEFQTLYHERVYPLIRDRKFLWGSFVWNMFDFGSANRSEGKLKGLNGKGLVTFDRSIRKDSYFYYKAQWSDDPFVHIASGRFAKRSEERIDIKVYTTLRSVELYVNGKSYGKLEGNRVFVFHDIPLEKGKNTIRAIADKYSDTIEQERVEEPEASYVYVDPNPGFNVKNWFTLDEGENDLFPKTAIP